MRTSTPPYSVEDSMGHRGPISKEGLKIHKKKTDTSNNREHMMRRLTREPRGFLKLKNSARDALIRLAKVEKLENER